MFSIARCLLRTKYQFQQKGDYNSKVFKLFLNFKYNGLCSRAFFFVESISDLNRRVCTMGRCLIVLCLFTKFFRVRAKIYKSRSSVVFSKSSCLLSITSTKSCSCKQLPKVPAVRNLMDSVGRMTWFVTASAKRKAILKRCLSGDK